MTARPRPLVRLALSLAPAVLLALAAVAAPAGEGARAADLPGLDADGLLPPRHGPEAVPVAGSPDRRVPAVAMTAMAQVAAGFFNASGASERHYDTVKCLDGLTFGFGHWPQREAGKFFAALLADPAAGPALARRMAEAFLADADAWRAFAADTGLPEAPGPDAAAAAVGARRLLAGSTRKNLRKQKNDGTGACKPPPAPGASLYHDHRRWLVPALGRALRDPAVVSFQARWWQKDVIDPAAVQAARLGAPGEAALLFAFHQSNPKAFPEMQRLMEAGPPLATVRLGGADWSWDAPAPHLAAAGLDAWRTLLLWQAMCPAAERDDFRIRNRNLAFFSQRLARKFRLPVERVSGGRLQPDAHARENCDPARAALR